ncbi:uncharacterized protein STEHIDRAFT_141118 [Stereum hirsutum FP-91666 SS1]|uniref:uncharacterized protein n=1 Tax=Stereum hirsutum (strain FP-91666) TaxID=721885 RepID=UPI000444A47C|nr:uncharacterized protein STEHIDRAFT_141118 [Stereum hirsutum FP-91666 SS1]EIM83307.1 hypothetical protein STEHIDRAFT_141118 [Stereum hirsutum FP-91666 SS1]
MTAVEDYLLSLPDSHPLQVAIRTYTLALSLSLGPALLSFLSSRRTRLSDSKANLHALNKILRREFGLTGFPFAITVAVGGGAVLQALWSRFEEFNLDALSPDKFPAQLAPQNSSSRPCRHASRETTTLTRLSTLKTYLSSLPAIHKAFLLNAFPCLLSILLMQSRHSSSHTRKASIPWTVPISPTSKSQGRTSATLDLTLMFVVRAVDAVVQRIVFRRSGENDDGESSPREDEERKKWRQRVTTRIDAMLFWASSARIMWCFFYEPERLPRSYVKWISSLASIDPRLSAALRSIRERTFSYVSGTTSLMPSLLSTLSQELGHSTSWGDPSLVPAYGGPKATEAWRALCVSGRNGVGGVPCEIVHGKMRGLGAVGGSCTRNVAVRTAYAFVEALALYTPVHILPILLTRPSHLLRPHRLFTLLTGILRSSTFLSTFVASIWVSVCFTRTLVLARLLPWISHDWWDGPYGCVMMGSLMCGSSIWIENGRRRGEMTLYVLPRAVRACLSSGWLRGGRSVKVVERIAFTLSLAFLTAATHEPECLRGLSRWTIAFIMNGPNAGLWKRRRQANSTVSSPKSEPRGLPPPAGPSETESATGGNSEEGKAVGEGS